MNLKGFIPGIFCIVVALFVLFRLTHYATFYAPSYLFWIGVVLTLLGLISVVKPLVFLWILDRKIALLVFSVGVLISTTALYWPIKIYNSVGECKIDSVMPYYSFNEYHEMVIDASPSEIKAALKSMHVRDIPTVNFLMKIRGVPADKEEISKLTRITENEGTFRTADLNYFVMDSTELLTLMLVKATAKIDPPQIKTIDQFMNFQEKGYIKVALNFRIIEIGNGSTLVTTETRNQGLTPEDRNAFGRYWRVIYPGSAIIRRLWLDALAKKANILQEKSINQI